MARRPRILFSGALYYVTFRGNARQDIFTDVRDRKRLLEIIGTCCDRYEVQLLLYCLMPHHVHLLVHTPRPNLNRFMGSLLTGYSVYFNLRHDRVGHLFQGRYEAQPVSDDEHLLKLSRHLHLNPAKTAYWNDHSNDEKSIFLRQYAWSSYRAYLGLSAAAEWLDTKRVLDLLPGEAGTSLAAGYQAYVDAGLREPDEDFLDLMRHNPLAIGPKTFRARMERRLEKATGKRVRREDVVKKSSARYHSPARVEKAVKDVTGLSGIGPGIPRRHGKERGFLAAALQKYSGLTQREVAGILGLTTGAAVCSAIKRASAEPEFKRWMNQLNLA